MRWREERARASTTTQAVEHAMAHRRVGRRLLGHDRRDRPARARRPAGPVPAQHRVRRDADPAGQRAVAITLLPVDAGDDRAAAGLATHPARARRQPALDAWARLVVRHRWRRPRSRRSPSCSRSRRRDSRSSSATPQRRPLAQGRRRRGRARASSSGRGHRRRRARPVRALVRRGDASATAERLRGGRRRRTTRSPAGPTGAARQRLVVAFPQRRRRAPRRPRDGLNAPRGAATRPGRRCRRHRPAQSADFIDAVYGNVPADARAHRAR